MTFPAKVKPQNMRHRKSADPPIPVPTFSAPSLFTSADPFLPQNVPRNVSFPTTSNVSSFLQNIPVITSSVPQIILGRIPSRDSVARVSSVSQNIAKYSETNVPSGVSSLLANANVTAAIPESILGTAFSELAEKHFGPPSDPNKEDTGIKK